MFAIIFTFIGFFSYSAHYLNQSKEVEYLFNLTCSFDECPAQWAMYETRLNIWRGYCAKEWNGDEKWLRECVKMSPGCIYTQGRERLLVEIYRTRMLKGKSVKNRFFTSTIGKRMKVRAIGEAYGQPIGIWTTWKEGAGQRATQKQLNDGAKAWREMLFYCGEIKGTEGISGPIGSILGAISKFLDGGD